MAYLRSLIRRALTLPIRLYQVCISPLIGSRCRYYPSCSAYAIAAIDQHGVVLGTVLAIKRISRCHPWADGGYDPVPENVTALKSNDR